MDNEEEEFFSRLLKKEIQDLGRKKLEFGFVPSYSSYIEQPEKENYMKAHAAVMSAVKRGEMRKASDCKCNRCDSQARYYHHNIDYEKENWLRVIPLCAKCHRKARHNFTAMILKGLMRNVSFLKTQVK